jgi:multidrug efflux pump subunit AcrA (membrane-fusion protein)
VKPGRTLGDLLEVQGALKSGERLVLSPAPELKPGARVSVKGG